MNTQKSLLGYFVDAYDRYRAERRAAAPEGAPPHQPARLHRFLRWLTPNGGTLLLIAALVLTQNVWARQMTAPAAPGPSATTINYQGRLADSGGTPLDGTYGMSFSLWDAATGGSLVWGPENHPAVPVSEGLFSVGLGSQTSGGIPTTTWNGDRYLEITVGGETLSPRELIRSVPIAGMALTVPDGAVTRAKAPEFIASTASNTEIQYGQVIAQATGTTGVLTVDVDFAPDFPSVPRLFLQPSYNYTPAVIATWGLPCDRTKCRVFLVRADGGNWQNGQSQEVDWMAVGQR
jgi:hypothetical protein